MNWRFAGNPVKQTAMRLITLICLLTLLPPAPWRAGAENRNSADFSRRYREILELKDKVAEGVRLGQLFQVDWEYAMTEFPESATWNGYPGQNHRWTDYSRAARERRQAELQRPWKAIESIDRAKLNAAEQLNYDLFKRNLQAELEGRRFKSELMPINQMGGVQQEIAQMVSLMPTGTVLEYEDILARLNTAGVWVEQVIALLKEGVEQRVMPPRITLRDVAQQIKNQLVEEPLRSPMLRAFVDFPAAIPAAEQPRLRSAAILAYREKVGPAFRELHRYWTETYLPVCRDTIACSELPDGKEWYAFNVRQSTTTRLTPREIHELGRAEVKRIRTEMDHVIRQTGFAGTFSEFCDFLRTDKRFYYETGTQLLAGYRDIAKRADPELIKLFGKLPRQPYGVVPIPAYAEKSQTTAYYQQGSTRAGRPGNFFANTYNLAVRPKWEMEALTLHEAVPGHHLQLALADELENVPEFRKHQQYTAFVEGWGLYSESLGTEMGFYQDPYSKFGQLTYEMWRAIRLVVDTGMHSLGWSRQQAIDYFKSNASKTEHDIIVEVDRYIVWPGQALAYKIGELKIKELRRHASQELGPSFNLRAFHDELLGHGALPLEVLEARMKAWVARQRRQP